MDVRAEDNVGWVVLVDWSVFLCWVEDVMTTREGWASWRTVVREAGMGVVALPRTWTMSALIMFGSTLASRPVRA